MNLEEFEGKPWRTFVRVTESDGIIVPSEIIKKARKANVVDNGNPEHPMVWIAFGDGKPSAYCIHGINEKMLLGARVSAKKGFYIPEEEPQFEELLAA